MLDNPPVTAPTVTPQPPKKAQEDLNIDVYESVFRKCLKAASKMADDLTVSPGTEKRALTVDIAKAIFDRFYNDQTAMKAGATQAKAMIDGLTQVIEGRR